MNPAYEAEITWFHEHPDETERVRPATVEEQVRHLKYTREILESVRVVRTSEWYWTPGHRAAILRTEPLR